MYIVLGSRFYSVKSKVLSIILLSFLPMLFAACGNNNATEKKPKNGDSGGGKGIGAEVFIVKATALQSVYQSSGNLLANEAINVYPEVGGRITAIHFKEGSRVHKGDLLIQLNGADIAAQIQKLAAQKKLQEITKDRQTELLNINGISKQEYDNTLMQIASIEADITYYKAQLAKLQIRSPFSGVIGLRNISTGAIVNTTTLITTIQQTNPLKLDFSLPEQYQGMVKTGATIQFTGNSFNDTLMAKVIATDPVSDAATRTITLRAQVDNSANKLVPGAFVNVHVPLNRNSAALTIPTQCIIPTTKDKKVVVLRNGKAQMQTVQTGERLAAAIEITHGLQAGDTVLTTGIMQVKPDMPVSIVKVVEL